MDSILATNWRVMLTDTLSEAKLHSDFATNLIVNVEAPLRQGLDIDPDWARLREVHSLYTQSRLKNN